MEKHVYRCQAGHSTYALAPEERTWKIASWISCPRCGYLAPYLSQLPAHWPVPAKIEWFNPTSAAQLGEAMEANWPAFVLTLGLRRYYFERGQLMNEGYYRPIKQNR